MSCYLSVAEINTLKYCIDQEYMQIEELKKNILFAENNIKNVKQILYKYCNHNRQIDRHTVSERTEYYCVICEQSL